MAVTAAVPVADAVNVEEHGAVAAVPDRVQVVKAPVTPVSVSVTVPDGVIAVPGDTSVTVTVHAEPWLTTTGVAQLTAVVVFLRLTTMLAVPLLDA